MLRVGTASDYQPLSYLDPDSNTYVGFDAELADCLAAPLIHEPFTNGRLGALMPKGSKGLPDYVNDFLEKERACGRLDELVETYIYCSIEEGCSFI